MNIRAGFASFCAATSIVLTFGAAVLGEWQTMVSAGVWLALAWTIHLTAPRVR